MNTVDIINEWCYCLYSEIILTNPHPHLYRNVHVQPRSHDSANHNIAKFIRENNSPEGKSVEFLILWRFRKILLFLREDSDLESTFSWLA